MKILKRKKIPYNHKALFDEISSNSDSNRNPALFIEFVASLRPTKKNTAVQHMQIWLNELENDPSLVLGMQQLFTYLFNTKDFQTLFTDVGLHKSGTFFSELFRQLKHRILPPLPQKRSMSYLLERAFYKPDDYKWVNAIPDEDWVTFFSQIIQTIDESSSSFKQNLIDTLNVLSYRVAYLGLEEELSRKLTTKTEIIDSFLEQNKKVQLFIHLVKTENVKSDYLIEAAEKVLAELKRCKEIILNIKSNTDVYGTSINQSYLLLRTSQQIERIHIIIRFLTPGLVTENIILDSVRLFEGVIERINKRNSIKDLYQKNSEMLAYQIAEHKSASGEHYITTTRKEYYKFFIAAVAGGFIISFAALIKALLHKIHMPMFWQYFFYGLNYAIAFVTLFLTGASLATKQPTMTASALASSLDTRKGGVNLKGLALTFGKVWRSQFAAFAGNLIIVFPMAYLLSMGWEFVTQTTLLHDKHEALQALRDQNPLKSLAWFYACITGIALFLSGIITGMVDNFVIYSNVANRLQEQAYLKRIYSGDRLKRLGVYVEKNLGGILGNISLGFMLGYAGMIGLFFGIPFDIRHITISTAYYGFGVHGLENNLIVFDWIWTTIGVIGIGFFNFLVSFSLAFYVALRSRNLSLRQLPQLGKLILKYFTKYPLDFIYPPKKDRKDEDVFKN